MSEMILIPCEIGDELTKYLELLEEYLRSYSKEFLRKSKEEFGEGEEGEKPIYIDEYCLYEWEYPNILRKSFIITCYSMLERVLIAECELQKKLKMLPEDLKKKSVIGAKEYLEQHVKFDLRVESWKDIDNIRKIRNCIVHNDFVSDCRDPEDIRRYVKTREDIYIEYDAIILTKEYCRYVVDTFSKFEFDIKRRL